MTCLRRNGLEGFDAFEKAGRRFDAEVMKR